MNDKFKADIANLLKVVQERNKGPEFDNQLEEFAKLMTDNYHLRRTAYFKHLFFPEFTDPVRLPSHVGMATALAKF